MIRSLILLGTLGCSGLLTFGVARGADEDRAGTEFFEKKIRPVLVERCDKCHSGETAAKQKGGLRIDSRDALLQGGESGPAIVPGKPNESLLIDAIRYESFEMPPNGKLPANVVADFVRWVEMGAPDPREPPKGGAQASAPSGINLEEGRKFWSFQPVHSHQVPVVANLTWPRTDVDRFLLNRIEAAKLQPVEDANRGVLIRRMTFDLTGLPPTPEEIAAFENDPADDDTAIATVVDRLLASRHFGERWGRHWLDVARFSQSTGGGRSLLYLEAWRYRDYVFNSINNNLPFDRFVIEQVAGDLLPAEELAGREDSALIATGFLAMGPTNLELQDKVQLRMDVIDEQVDTLGRAFLGMTLGCARCHDHKFDPIPVTDYYALAGILGSTRTFNDGNVASWVTRPLPASPEQAVSVKKHREEVALLEAEVKRLDKQLKKLNPVAPDGGITVDDEAAELVGTWTESVSVQGFIGKGYRHATGPGATATFRQKVTPGKYEVVIAYTPSGNRSPNALIVVKHSQGETTRRIDQRKETGNGRGSVSVGKYQFGDVAEVVISTEGTNGVVIADGVRFVPLDGGDSKEPIDDDNEKFERLTAEHKEASDKLATLKKQAPVLPMALSVDEEAQPKDEPIAIRGNARNLGPPVPRGVLQVATIGPLPTIPKHQSGRLELARWIASRENPLTARVTVNRVWAHLFDEGLVRTVDNFGTPGERPSHPELLDHLALTFMDEGWNLKSLIRRLMLSRAYRLSSRPGDQARKVDPDNRLYTHQNRRRLEAEAIYDAMLNLSGELTLEFGGPTVRPKTSTEYGYKFDVGRRAVYLPVFRNELPELFSLFDFPNPNASQGHRDTTTLSTQALFLMNDPFVIDRARKAATRLLESDPDENHRLDHLYLTALGRLPTSSEREIALNYVSGSGNTPSTPPTTREQLWTDLTHSLIATIDFRQVE
ncbi:MAG: DUF1553 domain-containing protein [Planctomycetaceae bacterium]